MLSKIRFMRRPAAAPVAADPLYCDYSWESITVLSDGTYTCGLDDPHRRRNFGNAARTTIREAFNGAGMQALRENLRAGHKCPDCRLYGRVAERAAPVPDVPEMPRRLILETTIRCNLRCRNPVCDLNNERAFEQRDEPFLSWENFVKVMDEAGPHLDLMWFMNYGEPFLHPRALDMLRYAKRVNPGLCIITSTNGIPLTRGTLAEDLGREDLLHYVNFTIAGSDNPTYQKYHKGGSFEAAVEGMRRLVNERNRLGRRLPEVYWRYLLFNWNDSDEQIETARAMAREIGVDRLTFYLCTAPLEGRSRRRAPGTPGYDAIREEVAFEFHYRLDPFADRGLQDPEYDPALGSYAWTSRAATLDLPPQRRVLRLSRNSMVAPMGGSVVISTPWETREARVGIDAWADNELSPPPPGWTDPFEVKIECSKAYVPFRQGTGDDERELGVMLSLDCFAVDDSTPLRTSQAQGFDFDPPPPARRRSRDMVERFSLLADGEPGRIVRLHRAAFGRRPGGGELEALLARRSARACAEAIVDSGEFQVRHRGVATERIVASIWRDALGVDVPPGVGDDIASHLLAIADDARFRAQEASRVFASLAYLELYGRSLDPSGYEHWPTRLDGGTARHVLIDAMLASPELRPVPARAKQLA